MSSVAHQYLELSDKVYCRYRKVVNCAISFKRISPYEDEKRTRMVIDGIVESRFKNFNIDTKELQFEYSTDIIELYSAEEDKFFKLYNKYLFEQGLIEPYDLAPDEINNQAVTENDLLRYAVLNLQDMQSYLETVTAFTTLRRLRTIISNLERPQKFVDLIDNKLTELSNET